jgi:hypothetical protein
VDVRSRWGAFIGERKTPPRKVTQTSRIPKDLHRSFNDLYDHRSTLDRGDDTPRRIVTGYRQ